MISKNHCEVSLSESEIKVELVCEVLKTDWNTRVRIIHRAFRLKLFENIVQCSFQSSGNLLQILFFDRFHMVLFFDLLATKFEDCFLEDLSCHIPACCFLDDTELTGRFLPQQACLTVVILEL